MKKEILLILEKIVKDLTNDPIKIDINIPKDINHGDFTTNIAFQLAKKLGKNLNEVAREIAEKFEKDKNNLEFLEKVEVLGGFINFWLKKDELIKSAREISLNPQNAGKSEVLKNKKIIVEFTDPNPFKELHIGHVYSNTIGEAISGLLESQGAEVKRANYQGDVGMHVAKAIWGMIHFNSEIPTDSKSLSQKAKFLGKAYVFGAQKYEEDEIVQTKIKELNKEIYALIANPSASFTALRDYNLKNLYEKGKTWSLDYFNSLYKRLNMNFDYYYFESVAGPIGLDLVKSNIENEIFKKDNGAVIFAGEKYGLHTRVFINSQGLPTYEAKELGLAITKYNDFKYDLSVIITGNEINEYFKVLLKVLSLINFDLAKKTKHLSHGMVKLASGKKMSSRSGQVITAEEVLNEAQALAKRKIIEAKEGVKFEGKEADLISDIIGVGAIKYTFLKSGIGNDISFSFEESVNLEGNSGPYLQYTYARTQSILGKAGRTVIPISLVIASDSEAITSGIATDSLIPRNDKKDTRNDKNEVQDRDKIELVLLRKLYQFSEIIQNAAHNLAPNMLCEYLFELASSFNLFYQKKRIINAESPSKRDLRLLITQATGVVLKQGLGFLGIVAPEKM